MRVGLFDSGVGGLTVLKSLMDRYPHNEYIYFGDTLNNPYGNKSKDELLKLARKNINFLLSKNVSVIVIACGTISSNCLDELKSEYKIPIYDIISPVINYLNESNYHNIGVIATEKTISSHIFRDKINKNVYEIATPKLVLLIEEMMFDKIDIALDEYLHDYTSKLDALVLGCTHYPIVSKRIEKIFNNKIRVIDMADFLEITNGDKFALEIYFSKLSNMIIRNTLEILDLDNIEIKEIDIDKY